MSGELFVNGQFIGHAVKDVQVATVDPDPQPIAIAPRELSIKLQAVSIDKDSIDALFMNLPPVPESAAITTREFVGKLRNIHTDPTQSQAEHVTVTGDLDDLVFFDAAKNRRFRRWKRNRMLRNCRERARRRERSRRHLRAATKSIAKGKAWLKRETARLASVLKIPHWVMDLIEQAQWRIRNAQWWEWPERLEDINFVRARFGMPALTLEDLHL